MARYSIGPKQEIILKDMDMCHSRENIESNYRIQN